jgi:MFS family permease
MGIAGMLMTYLVGELITRVGSVEGYQFSLILAFGVGMFSTYFFSRIKDQQAEQPLRSSIGFSPRDIWRDLRAGPVFLSFCFAAALWNFFVNVSGPFFNVYMAQNLNFTAAMIGVTIVSTSLSKMLIQRKVGELSDRWGAARVQGVCMLLIPVLPLTWIFITQLWQVVALNIAGGVLWGAFELASFNFLLVLIPAGLRARYSAVYQIVVTVALAGGAVLGGSIILWWGYNGIFLVSAFGRIAAALIFLFLLRNLYKRTAATDGSVSV